jgi:hypothetical protein
MVGATLCDLKNECGYASGTRRNGFPTVPFSWFPMHIHIHFLKSITVSTVYRFLPDPNELYQKRNEP